MTSGLLAEGSVFAGDYRVVRPLNAGGMGAVYVATQLSTGKERALKVMQPQLVASPEFRRRFEQEARVGAQIASEHVVEVQAAGVDAQTGMPFIIMELLRGADLAQQVESRGPVPPGEVRVIFEQLCHAVGAAHAAGIVHRDLKPENVFLAESLRAGATFVVKVLDFGIAKLAAEAGSRSTAALGSPLWMAPEQTERAPITPAADVWALGLIVFYMFTGKPYWRAAWSSEPTVTQLLREICIEPISPASARAAEIGASHLLPAGFDGWFAACVTRAPGERFPDAQRAWAAFAALGRAPSSAAFTGPGHDSTAFGATLAASSPAVSYSGPRPSAGVTPPGVVSAPSEAPRRGGWVGLLLVGLVLLGVVCGGVATFLLARRNARPLTVAPSVTLATPSAIPSAPVLAVETASPEVVPTLTAASAPLRPPPAATTLAIATKPPPPQATATTLDPGMLAIPPAPRSDVPPVATTTTTTGGAAPDRAAVAASLRSISSTIQTCARTNGPTGQGHVTLTYLPNGYVASASVGPPYAGTAVGGCVVSKYRKSVIPSFAGSPTPIGASFTIR